MTTPEVEMPLSAAQLRRSFFLVVTGRLDAASHALAEEGISLSDDELRGAVRHVHEASEKSCFFCGQPNVHTTGWLQKTEAELALDCCERCFGKEKRRKVYYPRWEQRLPEIAAKMAAGLLDEDTILYTDVCSVPGCKKGFQVTAKNAVIGYNVSREFRGWDKCFSCTSKERRGFKAGAKGLVKKPARKAQTSPTQKKTSPRKNALTFHIEGLPDLAELEAKLKAPSTDETSPEPGKEVTG